MALCASDLQNLGFNRCPAMPEMPRGMFTVPMNFEATPEEVVDPLFWQAALVAGKAERIYKWPDFVGFENASEENTYEETPLADLFVRAGKYRFRFHITDGLCSHRAMFSHNGGNKRVVVFDIANQMWLTKKSNGNFTGLTVSLLNTENLVISDGSVSTKTPVYVVLRDPKELNQSGYTISAPFINELEKLTDVEITKGPGVATASAYPVIVANACDGTEVTGLLPADFIARDSDGVIVAVTAAPYANGVYTLASAAGFEDGGTVTLRAAALLTVKAYEAVAPLVLDVP